MSIDDNSFIQDCIYEDRDKKQMLRRTQTQQNAFLCFKVNESDPQLLSRSFFGYSPNQIKEAYGLNNVNADGTGQIVAIISAFSTPTVLSDFKTFDAQFGIGQPNNLVIFSQTRRTDPAWALETSLDVQWVHAIAPGATILLVQARSSSLTDLLSAVNYAKTHGASVISMSWGFAEFPLEGLKDSVFNAPDIVFLAASGDIGGVISWPATAPNVVAVGGTTLALDPDGTIISETGWSGSGGGISRYERIPGYQVLYGLTGRRQTPDISMNADPHTGVPVYNSFGYKGKKGWFQLGGTSYSVQTMAGVIALVNQLRVSNNKPVLNTITMLNYLYNTLGKGSEYVESFNDITIGKAGKNVCKTGYDNVTGLGTPRNTSDMSGLIAGLVDL